MACISTCPEPIASDLWVWNGVIFLGLASLCNSILYYNTAAGWLYVFSSVCDASIYMNLIFVDAAHSGLLSPRKRAAAAAFVSLLHLYLCISTQLDVSLISKSPELKLGAEPSKVSSNADCLNVTFCRVSHVTMQSLGHPSA